ncbi:MAG: creatininase family protein [Crenarchaeota archaeon]|nr:creatininase family protein [Thermoproteota archaeon]
MRLENITWPGIQAYFSSNDGVIMAIGSIECHGRHLPVGTDTLIPEKLLEMIEDRISMMIAPTVPFGVCPYFEDFPGTINIGEEILYPLVSKIVTSLYKAGARRFIFLNGHGGNIKTLERIGYDIQRKKGLAAILNWWKIVGEINQEWKGGHGGAVETAAIMALNSDLVDENELYEGGSFSDLTELLKVVSPSEVAFQNALITIPRNVQSVTDNGWFGLDHPENANVEWGIAMLSKFVDYFCDFIEEFNKIDLGDIGILQD